MGAITRWSTLGTPLTPSRRLEMGTLSRTFLQQEESYTDLQKEEKEAMGPTTDVEKQKDKLPLPNYTGSIEPFKPTFPSSRGEKKRTKDKEKVVSFSKSNQTRLFKKKGVICSTDCDREKEKENDGNNSLVSL